MKTFKNISNSLVALPGYMLKPGQSVSEDNIHPNYLPNFYKMASLGLLSITTVEIVKEVITEPVNEVVEPVEEVVQEVVQKVVQEVVAPVEEVVAPVEEVVEPVEEVVEEESTKINVNTATKKELQSLNGVGARLADRIIQARPFTTLEELPAINGFSAAMLEEYSDILDC